MSKKQAARNFMVSDQAHQNLRLISDRTGLSISHVLRMLIDGNLDEIALCLRQDTMLVGAHAIGLISDVMRGQKPSRLNSFLSQVPTATSSPVVATTKTVAVPTAPSPAPEKRSLADRAWNEQKQLAEYDEKARAKFPVDDFGIRVHVESDGNWIALQDMLSAMDWTTPTKGDLAAISGEFGECLRVLDGIQYINVGGAEVIWAESKNRNARYRIVRSCSRPFLASSSPAGGICTPVARPLRLPTRLPTPDTFNRKTPCMKPVKSSIDQTVRDAMKDAQFDAAKPSLSFTALSANYGELHTVDRSVDLCIAAFSPSHFTVFGADFTPALGFFPIWALSVFLTSFQQFTLAQAVADTEQAVLEFEARISLKAA